MVFIKTSRLFNVVCTIHNKCKSEKDLQKTLHFGDFNHKTNNIVIIALENTGRASLRFYHLSGPKNARHYEILCGLSLNFLVLDFLEKLTHAPLNKCP